MSDQSKIVYPPRTKQRRFVVVPRDPHERPDVPLRLPTHYCTDCGQRYVPCYACETLVGPGQLMNGPQIFPLVGVHNGLHLANCPDHGPVSIACPHRSLTGPNVKALPTRRGDDPQARTWREVERRDERMRERAAITLGVLIGFVAGLLVMGVVLTLWFRSLTLGSH